MNGLLDSSILVDLLRRYRPAEKWIGKQQVLGASAFVWMEIIEGAQSKRDLKLALSMLGTYPRVEPTLEDIRWALGQLTKLQLIFQIGAFDCLIASASHRLQIPIFTTNLKHMRPLLGSLAVRPYT